MRESYTEFCKSHGAGRVQLNSALNSLAIWSHPAWTLSDQSEDLIHVAAVSQVVKHHRTNLAIKQLSVADIIYGVKGFIPDSRLAKYGDYRYDQDTEEMYIATKNYNCSMSSNNSTSIEESEKSEKMASAEKSEEYHFHSTVNYIMDNLATASQQTRIDANMAEWLNMLDTVLSDTRWLVFKRGVKLDEWTDNLLSTCMHFVAAARINGELLKLMETDIPFIINFEQLFKELVSREELLSVTQPNLPPEDHTNSVQVGRLWIKLSTPSVRRHWTTDERSTMFANLSPAIGDALGWSSNVVGVTNFLRRETPPSPDKDTNSSKSEIVDQKKSSNPAPDDLLGSLLDFIDQFDTPPVSSTDESPRDYVPTQTTNCFPPAHGKWNSNLFPHRVDIPSAENAKKQVTPQEKSGHLDGGDEHVKVEHIKDEQMKEEHKEEEHMDVEHLEDKHLANKSLEEKHLGVEHMKDLPQNQKIPLVNIKKDCLQTQSNDAPVASDSTPPLLMMMMPALPMPQVMRTYSSSAVVSSVPPVMATENANRQVLPQVRSWMRLPPMRDNFQYFLRHSPVHSSFRSHQFVSNLNGNWRDPLPQCAQTQAPNTLSPKEKYQLKIKKLPSSKTSFTDAEEIGHPNLNPPRNGAGHLNASGKYDSSYPMDARATQSRHPGMSYHIQTMTRQSFRPSGREVNPRDVRSGRRNKNESFLNSGKLWRTHNMDPANFKSQMVRPEGRNLMGTKCTQNNCYRTVFPNLKSVEPVQNSSDHQQFRENYSNAIKRCLNPQAKFRSRIMQNGRNQVSSGNRLSEENFKRVDFINKDTSQLKLPEINPQGQFNLSTSTEKQNFRTSLQQDWPCLPNTEPKNSAWSNKGQKILWSEHFKNGFEKSQGSAYSAVQNSTTKKTLQYRKPCSPIKISHTDGPNKTVLSAMGQDRDWPKPCAPIKMSQTKESIEAIPLPAKQNGDWTKSCFPEMPQTNELIKTSASGTDMEQRSEPCFSIKKTHGDESIITTPSAMEQDDEWPEPSSPSKIITKYNVVPADRNHRRKRKTKYKKEFRLFLEKQKESSDSDISTDEEQSDKTCLRRKKSADSIKSYSSFASVKLVGSETESSSSTVPVTPSENGESLANSLTETLDDSQELTNTDLESNISTSEDSKLDFNESGTWNCLDGFRSNDSLNEEANYFADEESMSLNVSSDEESDTNRIGLNLNSNFSESPTREAINITNRMFENQNFVNRLFKLDEYKWHAGNDSVKSFPTLNRNKVNGWTHFRTAVQTVLKNVLQLIRDKEKRDF